jgi:hypothetical protein
VLFAEDLDIRSSDHVLEETAARRTRKPAGADRQVATLAILEEDLLVTARKQIPAAHRLHLLAGGARSRIRSQGVQYCEHGLYRRPELAT